MKKAFTSGDLLTGLLFILTIFFLVILGMGKSYNNISQISHTYVFIKSITVSSDNNKFNIITDNSNNTYLCPNNIVLSPGCSYVVDLNGSYITGISESKGCQ